MLSRAPASLRRAILGHRRLIAFLLVAAAVLLALRSLAPPSPATATMLVATHDLQAGSRLTAADLTVQHITPRQRPDGTVSDAAGRVLGGAVRRGEPITDARLLGSGTAAPDGLTAVPVRLPDGAMAALLDPGERVDLYATDPSAGGTTLVARDVLVLAVPPKDTVSNGVTGTTGGRLVVVGVAPSAVGDVTDASVRLILTVAFRD